MQAKVPTELRDRATKTMTLVSCTSISSRTVCPLTHTQLIHSVQKYILLGY